MTDTLTLAEAFARQAHQGQTRKGEAREPYIVHVEEVARLTASWGGGEIEIAAAWLHDTVEDCDVHPDDLEALFGAEVARLVAELTDDKSLPKAERKRLQVVHAPGKSEGAALVKIADKTSNLRALVASPPADWGLSRRSAYVDWAEAVVLALSHRPAPAFAAFEDALRLARNSLLS